jgi:hypothetical protein
MQQKESQCQIQVSCHRLRAAGIDAFPLLEELLELKHRLPVPVGTVPLFTNFHRRGIFNMGPPLQYRKKGSTVS